MGKKAAVKMPSPDRSAAISKSWASKATRAARSERTAVKVGGTQYRSVAEAFRQLGLPMEKHVKFRGELKAAGKATFDGNKFTVVAAE